MASDLFKDVMSDAQVENYEIIGKIMGEGLESIVAMHPFLNHKLYVILGDHVTTDAGTGCVHTTPRHGMEDFEVCKKYEHLPVIMPVNAKGVF